MEKIKAVAMAAIAVMAMGIVLGLTPAQGAPAELSGELTIAGSTTVLPINEECKRLLMEENSALRISVSGGGGESGQRSCPARYGVGIANN
jgi:ABC-type phosphate transport system substrate-binding protein